MDPQTSAMLAALLPILEGLFALGIPGIILGIAAIPALVTILILWINHRQSKQMAQQMEIYRTDTQNILREQQRILQEMAQKHDEVVTFYKNNVILVKNHERLHEASQTLIINNTRALEHLSVCVEAWSKK